jgi:hypothetical protein
MNDKEFRALYSDWNRKLGERLGQLPVKDGTAGRSDQRYSAQGGVGTNGPMLKFYSLNFERPGDGLTALCEWLCKQGCVDFKYDLEDAGRAFDFD